MHDIPARQGIGVALHFGMTEQSAGSGGDPVERLELDRYELAYLCGGGERVAMVALVALCRDGRVRITSDRHRVHTVRAEAHEAVESAVLAAVPDVGRVLGFTMRLVAESDAVQEIVERLRERRLLPTSRFAAVWHWRRVRAGRRVKEEAARGYTTDALERVAISGASAILDVELRKIFETHKWEPPVNVKPLKLGLVRGEPDPAHQYSPPYRSFGGFDASDSWW
ncbi:TIGR04222 domain-containing membrane protein [Actinomadura rubrobrunea]|uniref:TIGR04222 domain-containing membrane protein n=1 Tax=Actinomadura rubrobrunea TaxID=115335 RepID=UPI0011B27929|nr:TIGR04222 domain-containing membrane protein [Actinomadura rubrobrunea]